MEFPLLQRIFFVQLFQRLTGDEIDPELRSPLVDADSMSNDLRTRPCSVGKATSSHPCILESRYTVDGVKQSNESNAFDRAAECLAEGLHELIQLEGFLSVFLRLATFSGLPLAEALVDFSIATYLDARAMVN
jgi:hypothetical protein